MIRFIFLILFCVTANIAIAQSGDSVTIKGKLLSSDKELSEEGVIDLYYMRDANLVKKINNNDFEELRVARFCTRKDGAFEIKLNKSEKYYIRLYGSDTDIAELYIKSCKRSIDLGDISLPDMVTVKGNVYSYIENDTVGCFTYINIYRRVDSKTSEYLEKVDFHDSSSIIYHSSNDGAFEFKLRDGDYLISFIGEGRADINITVDSEPVDMGSVMLGPLFISTGGDTADYYNKWLRNNRKISRKTKKNLL